MSKAFFQESKNSLGGAGYGPGKNTL